ncbi:MAG: protein-methionine-sulfoxide reductase catalytic subunit MsrP, partial [Pseudomonadales bacterium]
MLIKTKPDLPGGVKPSEITPESVFLNRRQIVKAMGIGGASLITGAASLPEGAAASKTSARTLYTTDAPASSPAWLAAKFQDLTPGPHSTAETATPFEYVASYNNFYEFGSGKGDPAENAGDLITDPWQVQVTGDAEVTGSFALEDILSPHALQERVYRLRC